MSVVGICCNKELASSCIYNCDKHYCTNTEAITFNPVDRSCSGYINKEVFTKVLKVLKGMEENNV